MNYLFIDIDGPLLPGRSRIFPENQKFLANFQSGMNLPDMMDNSPPMLDPWSIRAHNLLSKYGNAKIVLVTNWRRWASIEEIQSMFAAQGLEFEYADDVSCARRGISSERVHDVALHLEEHIEPNSKVLIIDDDAGLGWLNSFFDVTDADADPTVYGHVSHNDSQIGLVESTGTQWKWLDIDYKNGMSWEQFKLGAEFLDVDWEHMNHVEFGVAPLTEEEKKKQEHQLELLTNCII